MRWCWITGAQGQVGKALRRLVEHDNSLNYLFLNRADLDISNHRHIDELAKLRPPSCIINLAAYTDVNNAENDLETARLTNTLAVKYLAMTAEDNNASIIHVSTDYVFDGSSNRPYLETDQTNPLNVYGKTKLHGEIHAQNLCSKHLIIRTSWVFSEFGTNFITTMIRLLSMSTHVRVVDDQLGGPTSAESLAILLRDLSKKIITDQKFYDWGIYNFCQKPYVSWFGLCCKLHEILANQQDKTIARPIPCSTVDFPQVAERPKNSMLNCSKIEQIGFSTSSWLPDLERVVQFRNNINN